jgi:hypothetical protein
VGPAHVDGDDDVDHIVSYEVLQLELQRCDALLAKVSVILYVCMYVCMYDLHGRVYVCVCMYVCVY